MAVLGNHHDQDEEVIIYAVRERDSDRVRYVGYSKDPVNAIEQLRRGRQGNQTRNPEVAIWRKAQRNVGKQPGILEQARCGTRDARAKV